MSEGNGKSTSPAKKVLVSFIQDRSGSMSTVWGEAVNGFRVFVEDLRKKGKEDGVDYLISLTTFDTQSIDYPLVAKPIGEVDLGVLAGYQPRSATPLYDAAGKTIQSIDNSAHGAEKIVVVIATDGYENSSREWTKDTLHAAVDAKLKLGNWTFVYLGAQPESWDDASRIGVGTGASARYQPARSRAAYAATSDAIHSMSASRSMGSQKLYEEFGNRNMMKSASMAVSGVDDDPTAAPPLAPPPDPATSGRSWRGHDSTAAPPITPPPTQTGTGTGATTRNWR